MDIDALAGVAIPDSVESAVDRLVMVLDPEEKEQIAGTSLDDLVVNYHFSLGQQIRNAFGLWGENPALMASCGSLVADDASSVILTALWVRLRGSARR
jgi:hypothetical protein